MTKYIMDRIKEKTSQGGGALIVLGVIVLIAGPFATSAAYAAIAFGIWQIMSKD